MYFAMQSELNVKDLDKALGDINSIRRQVARNTEFRGYGWATHAATGIIAVLAATVQRIWLQNPALHVAAYLGIWLSTAVACVALISVQMYTRTHRVHSDMADEMIRMAVEQFLPAAGAGVLLTFVLVHFASASAWLLPGLWQIVFSLGVFASCRFLPRQIALVGIWYLTTGLGCIALGSNHALLPWTMGFPFAAGQMMVAGILFFRAQEADDES